MPQDSGVATMRVIALPFKTNTPHGHTDELLGLENRNDSCAELFAAFAPVEDWAQSLLCLLFLSLGYCG